MTEITTPITRLKEHPLMIVAIIIAALAVAAISATVVATVRDGYRRVPVRAV